MREINTKKIHVFSPATSSNIEVVTEGQTFQLKKDSTKSLTVDEGDFLADQCYLSFKNPVKIEKLDSLFRIKLKENGYEFKTAVSLYNNDSDKKTFYGINDVSLLPNYLKLTYKVDIQNVIVLEGYVRGGWLENLLWGKSYYVILSIIACLASIILVMKKRNSKRSNSLIQPVLQDTRNERYLDITQVLPDESVWQEVELVTEPVREREESLSKPAANVIYLDEEKHVLIYSEMAIFLAPKVFGLFNQLSKGRDYFQSYEYLYQTLWTEKNNVDKKHLEQLVIRLRKDLKDIPDLSIDAIRGSGYQLKWKNDTKLTIEQIEYNIGTSE
ncbi:helix-turn-helix domain-containing protein [Parabacteroides faecis]|uniref:winged helix-turn-helix domain-containing protein n=1 Tax=Parabacteroides faecis TaxID=1217282 RepID=UPI002164B4AA|nr:helix-turn-helix domain-containing protein [Parabacteroides faecis]MCS2891207.1 helix-turn-helix domain-containing protein [Parabacteroides faecis]UVQ45143.1 helix-turn-helix domain-containing protein [Parabacteroides faecis]